MLKVITIMVNEDEAEPPTVYIGSMNKSEAALVCWQAFEAIVAEIPVMVVDTTSADMAP